VNYVLRDDFDGLRVRARYGQTTRGDGADKQLSGTWGMNFADGRGNFFVHASRNEVDGIQADRRSFRRNNPSGLTNFADGTRRNGSFAPAIVDVAGLNNGAFLRSSDDGISGVVFENALTSAQIWPSGVIFNTLATVAGAVNQVGPAGAANPNVPLNAFLGTFVAAFPDVANPVAGQNAFLPRLAVPIRFDAAGNVVPWTVARLSPGTPSTIGGAVGGDGFSPIFNTVLRVDQTRDLGNFNARFDLTDNIRVFTENTYGKIGSTSLRNAGSGNSAGSGTVENAALVMNVNNPYLTADNRAALAAAGITGNFVLSRTNQDIAGPNAFEAESRTFSTTNGLEGDFEWAGRRFDWDVALAYGESEGSVTSYNIKDVEFALALDAAVNPATGQIVCRSQLSPTLPTNLPGVSPNLIRAAGPDGIPTEQIFTPQPTRAQVDACVPLNPFGFDRMSQAAKDYVLGRQDFTTVNEQLLATTSISGEVIDLPGGKLQFAANLEWRKVENAQTVDPLSQFGRTRSAATRRANCAAEVARAGRGGGRHLPQRLRVVEPRGAGQLQRQPVAGAGGGGQLDGRLRLRTVVRARADGVRGLHRGRPVEAHLPDQPRRRAELLLRQPELPGQLARVRREHLRLLRA
ncbi:MAG: hypothetical protein ACK52I_29305, partial [Pseudomonadota bacterium]